MVTATGDPNTPQPGGVCHILFNFLCYVSDFKHHWISNIIINNTSSIIWLNFVAPVFCVELLAKSIINYDAAVAGSSGILMWHCTVGDNVWSTGHHNVPFIHPSKSDSPQFWFIRPLHGKDKKNIFLFSNHHITFHIKSNKDDIIQLWIVLQYWMTLYCNTIW